MPSTVTNLVDEAHKANVSKTLKEKHTAVCGFTWTERQVQSDIK